MKRFLRDDRGATAIEYGLICALIILVLVAGLASLGNESTGLFGTTKEEVENAMGGIQ